MAAIAAGARQVECTINVIWRTRGNAALEEIVMALRVRRDLLSVLRPALPRNNFSPPAQMLSEITACRCSRNKAVTDAMPSRNEAWIHQDGVPQESADLRD